MYIKNSVFAGISSKVPSNSELAQMYRVDAVNHCPCCGRAHWMIGRSTAECAFCETALPLAASSQQPATPMFYTRGTKAAMAA